MKEVKQLTVFYKGYGFLGLLNLNPLGLLWLYLAKKANKKQFDFINYIYGLHILILLFCIIGFCLSFKTGEQVSTIRILTERVPADLFISRLLAIITGLFHAYLIFTLYKIETNLRKAITTGSTE